MKLRLMPAGEFVMGAADDDPQAQRDEKPAHRVRITRPFYLGLHEVTRGQFRQFVDATNYVTDAEKDDRGGWGYTGNDARPFQRSPEFTWRHVGFEQNDDHPVVNVSWNDAVAFCQWLSELEDVKYRLPTEAEWEYACRAGADSSWHHGENAGDVAKFGNVSDEASNAKFAAWLETNKTDRLKMTSDSPDDGYVFTSPVGSYQPNAFGLFDMQGNVWEWCDDWDQADYYAESPLDDPTGSPNGKAKIRRGGSWLHSPTFSRSARRRRYAPDARNSPIGFRVAMTLTLNEE
ncbi:formylglycine-generating enzyme family protein [Aeoliella sp.]|uniref:formylglycine-generating enzyme family protein n=1 Tax=Aeoliella sp. TaxID=2795800 RepID=UPI003CCBDE44